MLRFVNTGANKKDLKLSSVVLFLKVSRQGAQNCQSSTRSLRERVTAGHDSGSLLPQCRTQRNYQNGFQTDSARDGKEGKSHCFGWEKKLRTGKRINQYKDADFTMLKYVCYSEHLHYNGKQWRESCRRNNIHEDSPPVPEPFWTHPYNHPGCSDTHVKLLKSGQGEKGHPSHPLPGGFDNFHIQISTWWKSSAYKLPFTSSGKTSFCSLTPKSQLNHKVWLEPNHALSTQPTLHNLKSMSSFRAGPAAEPPDPQRGDQSFMPLHALPSEWFLVCTTQPADNSSGTHRQKCCMTLSTVLSERWRGERIGSIAKNLIRK